MRCGTFLKGLLLFLLILSSVGAFEAVQTQTVHFEKEASSKTIHDAVKGWELKEYRLGAKAGQRMKVVLDSSNNVLFFNIWAPGEEMALFNGSDMGNRFTVVLPKDGIYRVRVYLMRNEARSGEKAEYTLTFAIH